MGKYEYALVKLMESRNINQLELARITGISNSSLSRYMNNAGDMSAQNAIKITRALGCSTDELLGLKTSKSPVLDELIGIYAKLSPADRKTLLKIARGLL